MRASQSKRGEYLPIKSWPELERPREKPIKYGSEHLSGAELIAIMLGTGVNNINVSKSALDLAKSLLSGYKKLNELL